MPVRHRPPHRDRLPGWDEHLTPQRTGDQLDHLGWQVREVCDGLVADPPVLPPGAAQQVRLVGFLHTVLINIVATMAGHVDGPTTFRHSVIVLRHIHSTRYFSDDTPSARTARKLHQSRGSALRPHVTSA